jgi:hypothetical protein
MGVAVNIVVWVISGSLLLWMLVDALRVETTYDRDLLVSSVEGEIEKEIQGHEAPVSHTEATHGN